MEEFRIRALRGALCEYLDDGAIFQLAKDVKEILTTEKEKFELMSRNYKTVLDYINKASYNLEFWKDE